MLAAVLAICPLGSACFAHGAATAPSEAAATYIVSTAVHDHSGHASTSVPNKATALDGCNSLQHCAPFSWTADLPATVTVHDVAGVRFAVAGANVADGIDRDPEVPPPRSPT
jgi:hypothetical protein